MRSRNMDDEQTNNIIRGYYGKRLITGEEGQSGNNEDTMNR